MQPNHQLLILAQVLIPMLLFGFCCNHTCSQDSRLWNYKSGMWLIKDNVSVIPPLQLGKEFKVNFGLHLYRCESSLKKCPVPASSIRGFYKDDQNQSIFSVTQIKVNPSTSYMVQDQEQYFTASFLGDPKQIMPDKDYLMHLSLEDDNDDSKVQSIGFHKFEKSTGNDDDPGGEEVDIAGTLFNFFNQQYAAIKQENSKILGKYSDKQALEFSKKFVNQKIQRLRKANAKCKSYRFAIAKIIKDLNQDHYGDDIIYVKFYRDEEFVYERNTGETKQEHAVGTPFSATLERYREDGTDRWKVTSIELFIDSFSDQSMPTATQIKKNIKGLEYPKWAYYNGPGIREHIDKYWDSYDPSFHNYLGYGGDCTNWASQILLIGKRPQKIIDEKKPFRDQIGNWFYDEKLATVAKSPKEGPSYNKWGDSLSFTNANSLYVHMANYEGQCKCSTDEGTINKLLTGDLIFLDFQKSSAIDHTFIVYDNSWGDVSVSAHSTNRQNSDLGDLAVYTDEHYNKDGKEVVWQYCKFNNQKHELTVINKPIGFWGKIKWHLSNSLDQLFRLVRGRNGNIYMADTEVTQAQWNSVMGYNNSYPKGEHFPVNNVSWNEIQTFLGKLSTLEENPIFSYRLPTKEEWAQAASAGASTDFHFGNSKDELKQYAWYRDNSGSKMHRVGQLKPNDLGLYDVHGNVSEWVSDSISTGYRYVMNCAYDQGYSDCKLNHVSFHAPEAGFYNLGFRLVLETNGGDSEDGGSPPATKPSKPKISPLSGTYDNPVAVTIESSPGTTIFYSISSKESAGDIPYQGSFTLTNSVRVSAVAVKGNLRSDPATVSYSIGLSSPSNPTADPVPGHFTNPSTCVRLNSPDNAPIYYTTDGSDPRKNGIMYTSCVRVQVYSDPAVNLKAVAKLNNLYSPVMSSTYGYLKNSVSPPSAKPRSGTYEIYFYQDFPVNFLTNGNGAGSLECTNAGLCSGNYKVTGGRILCSVGGSVPDLSSQECTTVKIGGSDESVPKIIKAIRVVDNLVSQPVTFRYFLKMKH